MLRFKKPIPIPTATPIPIPSPKNPDIRPALRGQGKGAVSEFAESDLATRAAVDER